MMSCSHKDVSHTSQRTFSHPLCQTKVMDEPFQIDRDNTSFCSIVAHALLSFWHHLRFHDEVDKVERAGCYALVDGHPYFCFCTLKTLPPLVGDQTHLQLVLKSCIAIYILNTVRPMKLRSTYAAVYALQALQATPKCQPSASPSTGDFLWFMQACHLLQQIQEGAVVQG